MSRNNEVDLRRFFREVRRRRRLYLASFVVISALAALFAFTRMPRYTISSMVMIEDSDDRSGSLSSALNPLARVFSVGGFGSASVEDEVFIITSTDLKIKMIKALGLNRTYTTRDGLRKHLLTRANTPVIVDMPEEFFDTISAGISLNVDILPGSKVNVTVKKGGLLGKTLAHGYDLTLPTEVSTIYGNIKLLPGDSIAAYSGKSVKVSLSNNTAVVEALDRVMDIDVANKLSDVIELNLTYPDRQLGKEILNEMMSAYNARRLDRKRENAEVEVKFYDERIASLFADLTASEKKMEEFKRGNDIVDISGEARLLATADMSSRQELIKQQAEIDYYKQILRTLNSDADKDNLIPVIEDLSAGVMADPMVKSYNEAILERRSLRRSAKEGNTVLTALNERIDQLRKGIISNVNELLSAADLRLKSTRTIKGSAESRIKQLPGHEREYTTLLRDNTIKNELFVFLMEKRESAELKLRSTNNLGFIFEPAYASVKPDMTRPLLIFAGGVLLSLLIPTFISLLALRRNKIESTIDLNFDSLESQAVDAAADSPGSFDPLIANLASHADLTTLYVADTCGSPDIVDALKQRLADFGYADKYSFETVANPHDLGPLSPRLADKSAALLLILRSNAMTRSDLRAMLRTLRATPFCIITR